MIDGSREMASRTSAGWTWIFIAALVIGGVLRLWDLGGPGIAHPEIYIPGIDLVPGISEPPPRHGFFETLSWHFHSEPHPVGFYMAAWAWTKLAGTSAFALRLPSALLGILTIWLLWRLGSAVFDRMTGAIASLLLALNGFHVYWSQMARMYAAGTALAVVATWALVTLTRSDARRPWLEIGYAAALIAGTQTDELFWAVPFLHLAWAVLLIPLPEEPSLRGIVFPWVGAKLRIVQIQAIALALASPEFVHAALLARHGAAPDPTPRFLVEYLGFGFLFETSLIPSGFRDLPLAICLVLAAVTLWLVVLGIRKESKGPASIRPTPIPFGVSLFASLVGVLIAVYLASISARHRGMLVGFALLPLLCLWLPGLGALADSVLQKGFAPVRRWLMIHPPYSLLIAMLALVPPLVFYAMSFRESVLATRAFLPFVPFLILLVAAGILKITSIPARTIGALMVTCLFVVSLPYFLGRAHSPRDYKLLASIIGHEQKPDDVIMVRSKSWSDTPIFYYLPKAHYLAGFEAPYLAAHPLGRVWLPEWTGENDPNDHRRAALASTSFREVRSWAFEGGRVELFVAGPQGNRRSAL